MANSFFFFYIYLDLLDENITDVICMIALEEISINTSHRLFRWLSARLQPSALAMELLQSSTKPSICPPTCQGWRLLRSKLPAEIWNIYKSQKKHWYVTFKFAENGLAATTNTYCDFNSTLMGTVTDGRCNLQYPKLKIHDRIYRSSLFQYLA